jgi:hypothetical protein
MSLLCEGFEKNNDTKACATLGRQRAARGADEAGKKKWMK